MNARTIHPLLALLAALAMSAPAAALEVNPDVVPEIAIGGRIVATGKGQSRDRVTSADKDESDVDFHDSSLLLSFRKYLFDNQSYGFANFGITVPEDDSSFEDDIFLHQVLIGVGARTWEASLGRTNLPNTLVSFPTVRDTDLLEYTHVLNRSLNGEGDEFQVYGGQIGGRWYRNGGPWSLGGWLTARAETDMNALASTTRRNTNKLNGFAVGLAYDRPEPIKFDRGMRYTGLMLDLQKADTINGSGDNVIPAVIGGFVYNMNDDPEHAWVLDMQGMYNFGEAVSSLGAIAQRAQAESYAVVAALRYVDSPQLNTRWQAALTVAWKDYTDFSDAGSLALVPSLAWRIGSGIEVVGQYRYLDNGRRLAADSDLDSSHTVWVGLTFSLSGTFNESVGERGAILDVEHNMSNPGPASRGH